MQINTGFWGARLLWSLAYRAARSGKGKLYFDDHPEYRDMYRLACRAVYVRH